MEFSSLICVVHLLRSGVHRVTHVSPGKILLSLHTRMPDMFYVFLAHLLVHIVCLRQQSICRFKRLSKASAFNAT